MKALSLLQRDQSLLQGQSIFSSSVINVNVFFVMEQFSLTQLIPPNILQTFSKITSDKRASASCGVRLWDGYFLRDTLLIYYYYSFSGSVRILER